MLLAIGGHPRSGTTLLGVLCTVHPEIISTHEFHTFDRLDVPYRVHIRRLRKRGFLSMPLIHIRHGNRILGPILSWLFLIRYLHEIRKYQGQVIDADKVRSVLHALFPRARVVGDKYPRYVFHLDKLVTVPDLFRVIIYRDCRDVTRSALEKMSRTKWRGRRFAERRGTAEKVAREWVHAIELMERHADQVHVIRYEELVAAPQPVLEALGKYLGVDPQGFRHQMIHVNSVGKYRQGLSEHDLRDVIAIAGPTMERLGYEI